MTCGALIIGIKNRESNSNVKFNNLFNDGMKSGKDLMTEWEGNSFAILRICWVGFCRESRWSRGGGLTLCRVCSVDDAPYQYMGGYAPKVRKNCWKLHFFLWWWVFLLCVVVSIWLFVRFLSLFTVGFDARDPRAHSLEILNFCFHNLHKILRFWGEI